MEGISGGSKTIENSEDDSGITMVDLLQEEEELENDAEAVLGSGDDSSCTYSLGYMKRQPLYACLSCCPSSGSSMGGVCLGCSYHCHEGHELVELYTKRYFKCDCGTSMFPPSNSCKLFKDKEAKNADNSYNQNFRGKYCTCNRPYPDPEDSEDDTMIQCIICEDWYHGRHLEAEPLPSDEEYSEMICQNCTSKLNFLSCYQSLAVRANKDENQAVDVVATSNEEDTNETNTESTKLSETDKNGKSNNSECKLKKPVSTSPSSISGALFFEDNWRKELCTCPACKDMYKKLNVSFLTDEEDTVVFYESEGRAKRQGARGVQRELDALSSLDRITRTEVVHEYNNLSTSLRDYLRKFAENGKVVKDEDIKEFFSKFSANKRQRTNGMQYFCK